MSEEGPRVARARRLLAPTRAGCAAPPVGRSRAAGRRAYAPDATGRADRRFCCSSRPGHVTSRPLVSPSEHLPRRCARPRGVPARAGSARAITGQRVTNTARRRVDLAEAVRRALAPRPTRRRRARRRASEDSHFGTAPRHWAPPRRSRAPPPSRRGERRAAPVPPAAATAAVRSPSGAHRCPNDHRGGASPAVLVSEQARRPGSPRGCRLMVSLAV